MKTTKEQCAPREGWEDASRELSAANDDALIWPEFPNDDDVDLIW
jgi:antitoxin MazE